VYPEVPTFFSQISQIMLPKPRNALFLLLVVTAALSYKSNDRGHLHFLPPPVFPSSPRSRVCIDRFRFLDSSSAFHLCCFSPPQSLSNSTIISTCYFWAFPLSRLPQVLSYFLLFTPLFSPQYIMLMHPDFLFPVPRGSVSDSK